MDSNDQLIIDALNARIERLEAEKARDNDTQACPSCFRSFPKILAYWPAFLIPGELRCTACYSGANGSL